MTAPWRFAGQEYSKRRAWFEGEYQKMLALLPKSPLLRSLYSGYLHSIAARISVWTLVRYFALVSKTGASWIVGNSASLSVLIVASYVLTKMVPNLFWVWMTTAVLLGIVLVVTLVVSVASPRRYLPRVFGVPGLVAANLGWAWMLLAALWERGWEFTDSDGDRIAGPGSLWQLPVWSALDTLPFVKVNDSLAWKQPVVYTQLAVGLIVLFVKLTLVLGVAEVIKSIWKEYTDEESSDDDTSAAKERAGSEAPTTPEGARPIAEAPPASGSD